MNIPIEVENFYRIFWKDPVCRNIFLLHKELLLEKNSLELSVADYYLQRIVISNSIKKKGEAEEKLVFRQENQSTSLMKKLILSRDKYFDVDNVESYLKKRFGHTFSLLKKDFEDQGIGLLLDKGLTLLLDGDQGFFDLLKEYKVIPEEIEADDESVANYIQTEFIKESGNFLKSQDVSDIFLSIDNISHAYNSMLKNTLINGYKQNISTFLDKDNFKSRLKVFDQLYEINILIGGKFKSYVECIECPPNTFNAYVTWNVKPSKLKIKCPQCKNNTDYLVPYYIQKNLYAHITDNDGLLSFAIEYIFYKKEMVYSKNVNLKDGNEIDFVLGSLNNPKALMEVKMFRNDRDDNVKLSNLKGTISQIKKTRNKLSKIVKKPINIPHYLVTNISKNSIVKKARTETKSDLKEFQIRIFTPIEFYNFIHDK